MSLLERIQKQKEVLRKSGHTVKWKKIRCWVELNKLEKERILKAQRYSWKPPLISFFLVNVIIAVLCLMPRGGWYGGYSEGMKLEEYFNLVPIQILIAVICSVITFVRGIFRKEVNRTGTYVCLTCNESFRYKGENCCPSCSGEIRDLCDVKWGYKTIEIDE